MNPTLISSTSNTTYKRFKRLLSKVSVQRQQKIAVVDTKHPLLEIFTHHKERTQSIIYDSNIDLEFWRPFLGATEAPQFKLIGGLFSNLVTPSHPTGLVVIISIDQLNPLINHPTHQQLIIVDGIQKAHNFGALIRNAAAFGVTGVFYSAQTVYPYHREAIRASAGTIFNLPINELTPSMCDELMNDPFNIYAADPHAEQCLNSLQVETPTIWIFGSEEYGIQSPMLKERESKITTFKVPMSNAVESLNVAVSSGIILFYSHHMIE